MTQHIFLHIPKTAGSSVRTLLQQNYAPETTIGFSGEPDPISWYLRRSAEDKSRYSLVHGHFRYGIHAHVRDYAYFAFLRNPVERHFSDYDFLRRYEPHELHAPIVREGITAQDWATIFDRYKRFRDLMTRYVCGDPDSAYVDRMSLEKAKMHIRREFALVGLAERFDESVLLLAGRLGWKSVFYLTRNVTSDRTRPTAAMREIAKDGLRRDLELYAFAEEIFEQSPELRTSEFQEALAEFRDVRTWLERYVANNSQELFIVGQELPRLDEIVRKHRATPALDRLLGRSAARVSLPVLLDLPARDAAGDAISRVWESLLSNPPQPVPPTSMITTSGSPDADRYVATMREYVVDVARVTKLQPAGHVLDLGCGCGRMASGLTRYLDAGGSYLGLDVWKDAIDWCQEHVKGGADFRFQTVQAANNYGFDDDNGQPNHFDLSAVPSNRFDVVLALSLFSHLKADDTRQYLELIARALAPNGLAYVTFFVMDHDARRYLVETAAQRSIQPAGDGMWYAYAREGFFAGFEPELLRRHFADCGLEIVEQTPGSWAQKPGARLYEDWFLLRRRS